MEATPDPAPLKIDVVPGEQQEEALRLLFGHLPPDARAALVTTLLAGSAAGNVPMAGLLGAWNAARLVGAVWAQLQPGRSGVLWPPRVAEGEPPQTALALLAAANGFLHEHQVTVAQALLQDAGAPEAALLVQGGYQHLADLLYQVSTDAYFPARRPPSSLDFEPYQESERSRLAAIVAQTYQQTRDCPQLNGVRELDDVLAGYQATGAFDPALWRIVRHEGADVGCLLLADHPGADQVELVYMGLVPAVRGRGLGLELVKFAQYLTSEAGRPRLVLAVDARNGPALDVYAAAGFLSWDQRSAFLRIFGPSPRAGEGACVQR